MKLNKVARLFLAWKRRKITARIKQKSAYYSLLLMRANAKQLQAVTDLVASGQVKTIVDKVFPLKDAVNAVLYVDKGRTKGKVVLKIW